MKLGRKDDFLYEETHTLSTAVVVLLQQYIYNMCKHVLLRYIYV